MHADPSLNPDMSVNNLISLLKDVSAEWERVGLELGVKWSKIKQIAKSRNHADPQLCMADLLDYWLRNDRDVSWEKVASALDEIEIRDVALKIRKTYCSPGKLYMCIGINLNKLLTTFGLDVYFHRRTLCLSIQVIQ